MSYFGTDGIRGQFGVFPITPDFLLKLGFVAGQVLMENTSASTKRPSVFIGRDTRLSGHAAQAALQAGFNAAGIDVHLLGVLPTPAIAHLTRAFGADMGVVISASHNPYQDNGVKFFSGQGTKISDALQEAINAKLDVLIDQAALFDMQADGLGVTDQVLDADGRYIEYCKGSIDYHISLSGLKVVVDCANGSGYHVAPRVLSELGADVVAIHCQPDGININDQCGSTHPSSLQEIVKQQGADVGIALDGDGDRIVMVDKQGNLVDGDGILYVLAKHLKSKGVVGTLMSNLALELALIKDGIGFERAKVGDRYVMQGLQQQGWHLGGEPSGHILCLDKSCTGDAIVAGLQVLACMIKTGQSLDELTVDYQPFPQTLINVRLSKISDPYEHPDLAKLFLDTQKELADQGRLLIRKSGTEPVIRVMVEHQDQQVADATAQALADAIKKALD